MLCRLRQLAARPPAEPIRKGVICAAKLKLITPRLSPLVRAAANQFPITPRASGALGVSPFGKSPHPLFFVFYGFRKAVNYRKKPRADDIRPYTVQYTSASVFSAGKQRSSLRCTDDDSPQTEPIKGGFMPREHPAKHLRYDFPRGFSGMGIFYTNKDSFFAVL